MNKRKAGILRVLGAKYDKLLAGPQSIFIDISDFCNLSCVSCWIHSPAVKNVSPPKFMEFGMFKTIIKQAAKWQVENISISGDGEPFLHPQIKNMVDCLTENNFYKAVTTNLTFKKDLLPYASKFDTLFIHIDAVTEQLYKKIHCLGGINYYRRTFNNLKYISEISKRFGKPKLIIVHLFHRLNYKYIEDILKLLNKFNVGRILLRPFEPTEETKKYALSRKHLLEVENIFKKNLDNDTESNIRQKTNIENNYQGLADKQQSIYNFERCYSGWFNVLIDFHGDVALCCHNDNIKVGNIKEKTLPEIWNSVRAKKMRLKLKYEFNFEDPMFKDQCRQCWWVKDNLKVAQTIKTIEQSNSSPNCRNKRI